MTNKEKREHILSLATGAIESVRKGQGIKEMRLYYEDLTTYLEEALPDKEKSSSAETDEVSEDDYSEWEARIEADTRFKLVCCFICILTGIAAIALYIKLL